MPQEKSRDLSRTKAGGVTGLLVLVSLTVSAHVIVYDLEKISRTHAAFIYLQLGYTHILPYGFDHILFVLSLFLLSPRIRDVIWQATAFTVAHSATLGLAIYGLIHPPPRIVEPVIALSIIYVAVENIVSARLRPLRIGIIFLFGLIHGMGFAGGLLSLGLPRRDFLLSLVMFNLGVELGQITVILLAYLVIGRWFGSKPFYRKRVVFPLSAAIAVVASFWVIQRVFFTG